MNKKMLAFLIVFASVSLVTAAWYFMITGTSIAEIISPAGYRNIALEFEPMTLSVENSSSCQMSNEFITINKDMTLSVEIIETVQDDSAGECLDYESDCETVYLLQTKYGEDVEIKDGNSINITAMASPRYINKTICCEAYSCPTTRTSTITLTQVA